MGGVPAHRSCPCSRSCRRGSPGSGSESLRGPNRKDGAPVSGRAEQPASQIGGLAHAPSMMSLIGRSLFLSHLLINDKWPRGDQGHRAGGQSIFAARTKICHSLGAAGRAGALGRLRVEVLDLVRRTVLSTEESNWQLGGDMIASEKDGIGIALCDRAILANW